MGVMALFQLHFLQNACLWVRMVPGWGRMCPVDTFLVFPYFLTKKYSVGPLTEMLLISMHSICFHGNIRKIFI